MAKRNEQRPETDEPALPFDTTQEIDASLVEQLLRSAEPTLTQTDFEDVTIVLPPKPTPRR